jgi:putative flippase GtrA
MSIGPSSFIARAYYKLFAHDFTRFIFIGGVGFVVNYVMLTILFAWLKVPILISQLLSAEIGLLATFTGNNFWAFRGHHHISIKSKLIKYHFTSGTGLIINTLIVTLFVKYGHLYYGLALVVGSLVALSWNYGFNKKFIFKNKLPNKE